MAENYFENIRIVGASIDEGITILEETWKMPHLLLCKSSEEDQLAAAKLVENLRNELKLLKESLEEDKIAVQSLQESQSQFLEESADAIQKLKEEVNDIKILFEENGYVEEPLENDLSILNNQLESLSVSNNSFVKNSSINIMEQSISDSFSVCDESSISTDSVNTRTPKKNNISLGGINEKLLLNDRPMEPVYSPYYYRMMKKK